MKEPQLIEFKKIGSPDLGYISVAELGDQVPFEFKRVYWTYYTPNHIERGGHAHKKLQQVIVAVSGIILFSLEDKLGKKYSFELKKPNQGLFIPEGFWRDIKFSHNAVLLCLASEKYLEDDYVRDYEVFKHTGL
ncbi:FdtA/QdtA family cupin domain-containing protein [Polaribacter sp. Z022]|uniref:sugar 3,4-ketoisomerase n=1 Tax=Polaribacter sp. Z022 TaxID=2927125 RepID=UPI00202170FF|nr:FdtA/QdtA family cupin domain-containing protein [Polaribacter sp. Z022]MCL7753177.1 FdtA/QdtA family cupin domain-containing protein [Polaribacter sp. Z022]